MTFDIRIAASPEQAAQWTTELIIDTLDQIDTPVLGLATGGTPLPVYAHLRQRYQAGGLSFAQATSFNLDEYVGLPPGHPQSYRHYMHANLFDHVDMNPNRVHLPAADQSDLQQACRDYESAIEQAGGIDLQLLGIGVNGHIGFNEPGSPHDSRTRVVDLAASTIRANARFFECEADVPRQAITMGIGTILQSRRIVLMAIGVNKADAIASAMLDPSGIDNPASSLQSHDDVVFVLDQEAAQTYQQRVNA